MDPINQLTNHSQDHFMTQKDEFKEDFCSSITGQYKNQYQSAKQSRRSATNPEKWLCDSFLAAGRVILPAASLNVNRLPKCSAVTWVQRSNAAKISSRRIQLLSKKGGSSAGKQTLATRSIWRCGSVPAGNYFFKLSISRCSSQRMLLRSDARFWQMKSILFFRSAALQTSGITWRNRCHRFPNASHGSAPTISDVF